MSEVKFTIEGKPVPWQRAGLNGGRLFTKPETRAWQKVVANHARKAMGVVMPYEGPVSLSVQFHQAVPNSWPKKKRADALSCALWPTSRPDLSNLVKSIEDACIGILYLDDSQIVSLEVLKTYSLGAGVLVRCCPVGTGARP
jgi:Holliday junction resolvase RusA-like endonuclease